MFILLTLHFLFFFTIYINIEASYMKTTENLETSKPSYEQAQFTPKVNDYVTSFLSMI